jgi:hypothetical protein
LGKNVRREHFPQPIIEQSFGRITGANYIPNYTLIVYFWQIKLAQENKFLTTFITPIWRYALNRLPMG